jgi:histone-lysine N-methyltransferase SETMAR
MSLSKEIIRNLLLYEFELGRDATTAANNINRAKRRQVVTDRTARRWFAKFREDNTDLNDQPRSGRPREIDREAIIEAIEEDPTLPLADLADDFDCTQQQIRNILKAAGKKWKKSNWIPHALAQAQKNKRKKIARKLLRRQNRAPFLNNVVTTDEKWIFFRSQRRPNQWLSPGQKGTPTPRPNRFAPKAMLIVFWDRTGPIHWDLLAAGQTINAERYCQHLDRCNQALPRRRRRNVILLQDNAKPHVARLTQAKLTELNWEWLDHPPYSPDLSPSDFHLFRSLEHWLAKNKFRNIEHLRRELTNWFDSKEVEFWRRGIDLLPERWEKCVQADGDYFE